MSEGEAATRRWFPDDVSFDTLVDGIMRRVGELRAEESARSPVIQSCLFGEATVSEPPSRARRRRVAMDIRELVSQAFQSLFAGLPEDHIVIEPGTNAEFISRCRLLGATASEYVLNKTLLNVRKAGWHAGLQRGSCDGLGRHVVDRIGYAAEIAARIVQLQAEEAGAERPSVDRLLCDPELRDEFDKAARALVPGFSTYQFRLAALAYRKSGRASTLRLGATPRPEWELSAPLQSVDPGDLPVMPGIYEITVRSRAIFVGSTLDLRTRILSHFSIAEGRSVVPPHLYDPPRHDLTVQWASTPAEWRPRRTDAVAFQLKRESKALLNLYADVG